MRYLNVTWLLSRRLWDYVSFLYFWGLRRAGSVVNCRVFGFYRRVFVVFFRCLVRCFFGCEILFLS